MDGAAGMLEPTLYWIEAVNKEFDIHPDRVLDIGCREQKGRRGARDLFPNSHYIGIDIKDGENVDKIMSAYALSTEFELSSFDAVLCLHVLEHLGQFWRVLRGVQLVSSYEAYFYVSIPTIGYPVHNHPGDYWRPTEQAVREVIMDGYEVLSLEHAKSPRGKHPFINCLGVQK